MCKVGNGIRMSVWKDRQCDGDAMYDFHPLFLFLFKGGAGGGCMKIHD